MRNIYDIHTHILPRVDDGAVSMQESLEIIEDELNQGVTGIMLTPHCKKNAFETEESAIYVQYKMLLMETAERFPEMDIRLGCEFHTRDDMAEELEKRRFVTLGKSDTILLEFSFGHDAEYIIRKTRELLELGYIPMIAHIEYYQKIYKKYKVVEELRNLGAGIQIDADGVMGQEGTKARKFCEGLLKRGLVDYVASDVHNMNSRRSNIGRCADIIEEKYGSDCAKAIFVENPRKIFEKT